MILEQVVSSWQYIFIVYCFNQVMDSENTSDFEVSTQCLHRMKSSWSKYVFVLPYIMNLTLVILAAIIVNLKSIRDSLAAISKLDILYKVSLF